MTPANSLCPGRISFDTEPGRCQVKISWEAVSERTPVNNFSLKLSTSLILGFCLLEVGATVFVDLRADAYTVIKILASLST